MRLKRLELRNYGCFRSLDLSLATEPGRITLITAPNGSGKSVLRQAFHDLLFDIPVQSPMRFRHGYTGMALHAEAVGADGVGFSFGWVRNGKPPRMFSDAARFEALRYGVTPQQLERMFALDTDRLRKGGTDLKGGATLSAALLAGTGELASAKSVKALIDKRRHENWGQGKSRPPLNAAAVRLDAARKRLRDNVQQPESRVREERDLARREAELAEARTVRDGLAAEIKRLNRVVLTRSHLEALVEAEAWLLAHADAPALPLDLGTSLAAAREGVALASVEHEAARRNLLRAAEAVGQIARDAACTAVADRLERLSGKLGEAEKAASDVVERRKEHASCLGNLRAELEAIGSPFPAEQAGQVIPTVGLRAEVAAAITAEVGLRTRCEVARNAVLKARAGLLNAEAAVRAAEPLPDGLIALLAEIRADRKPMAHAEEVGAKLEAAAAQVRRCLAMVPGWSGTAEQLRDLAVKGDSEFERLDATVKTMAATAAEKQAHRASLAQQDDLDRRALAALQRHDLPDASSIAAARAERDRGMRLVLDRAFGRPPGAAEEDAYGRGEPVPVVYERQVRAADAIADRRADELKQVQEAERLRRAIGDREQALAQAVRDAQHADGQLASARQAWAAAVAPLGLDGSAPLTELRQATAARRALVEALLAVDIASAEQEKLTARHRAWAGRLAAMLGEAVGPLGSLLARADQLVASSQAAERAVANREAAIEAARRAVPEALDTLAAAEAAMESWRALWARLLRDLHRPSDESPAAVTAVLDGIDRLEQHHREATALARRIADMDDDLAHFAAGVAELSAAVGQPVSPSPAETARRLVQRHRAAEAAEAAWGQAQLGWEGATAAAQAAADKLSGAQAVLAGVVASCGAGDDQEAEARIAASRAHADQVLHRDQARNGIAEHGDGLTIDALRLETEAVPADEVAERRRAAEEALAGAHAQTEAAAVSVSELAARLDTASSATDALDARVDYEAAAAEYERLLEDQLVLHLASTMLGDAMQVAEEAVGDTSLARTSEMFAAVTSGAYGLEVHDGPDGEELYAVERAYPSERKALDELSEGTRDQLYLALRIQALREHCATKTPLPFIADDILQTFDDDRARAALRVLCDISAELQVVVLSHHPHLRQVAASLGPGLVKCLDLSVDRLTNEGEDHGRAA